MGSHGLLLARDLEHELAVIDFDRVETKNLASQWFVKQMIGRNKATALKMQFLNFYDTKLQDYTVKLTALNAEAILGSADLVVECFDNAESRLAGREQRVKGGYWLASPFNVRLPRSSTETTFSTAAATRPLIKI